VIHVEQLKFSVAVIGGGMAGLCTALAAARHGADTVIVQNRPMFGGVASSECKMHVCGADNHSNRPNARETGIIEELLLENKRRNPGHNYYVWDMILWEKAYTQKNLTVLLNTHFTDVKTEQKRIVSIIAHQLTSERVFEIAADIFVDATGDGTLSAKAGAECMTGQEARSVYGERHAPEAGNNSVMGSTILFQAEDAGEAREFVKPSFAHEFSHEDLAHRDHSRCKSGYWWVEQSGDMNDIIGNAEGTRDELLKTAWGVWNHLKNEEHHKAEHANMQLTWMGMLPGKRDSRRVKGDYVLTGEDCFTHTVFPDTIGYGGWPMDMHAEGGFHNRELPPTNFIYLPDVYEVPYRCIYAKDFDNLMLAGRIVSASHLAFGSLRVMCTLSVLGQACGVAAAYALRHGLTPRGVLEHIGTLQQILLKEDAYLPNVKNSDPLDLARTAAISASPSLAAADNVINGVTREVGGEGNAWISNPLSETAAHLKLEFSETRVRQLRVTFDSNLSRPITPSIFYYVLEAQTEGMPHELVKDYNVIFSRRGKPVKTYETRGNYQRLNVIDTDTVCDAVTIKPLSTHGAPCAKIFEIRIY
jgi:ribulose 1,5-bisphosphate synthetase/thiazole synthase